MPDTLVNFDPDQIWIDKANPKKLVTVNYIQGPRDPCLILIWNPGLYMELDVLGNSDVMF